MLLTDGAIFFEISKAFDCMNLKFMSRKTESMRVIGRLQDLWENRSQNFEYTKY